jgi:hypothetical protein
MRTVTARLAPLALLACALALPARPARADVEDLTPHERRTSQEPATFVLRIEGGTNYAVTGNVGGTLSYFNAWSESEVELSAGLTFPDSGRAWQGGISLRKLFGERGDFFVTELALLWTKDARAVDPVNPLVTSHLRLCIGLGLEYRAGIWSYGLTGGLALNGVSSAPAGYVHGGIGFGF